MNQIADAKYFEDEVRNGFYVPSVMKRCWASQLTVLEELDDICEKLNIRYFADWGTLLGAVRHGGYIPWDDDLDVLMLRSDYNKLLKAWEEKTIEFPAGFEVRSFRNRPELNEFHGVVVGNGRISFEKDHLEKFHGFPYISAIDIFVLDKKSKSDEKQAAMAKNALFTIAVADSIADGSLSRDDEIELNLKRIREFPGVSKPLSVNGRDHAELIKNLREAVEEQFSQFEDEDSGKLIQNVPFGLKDPNAFIDENEYKASVKLPFEYTSVPVPVKYNMMLRRKYGEYLNIYKGTGAHNYPYFAAQEKSLFKDSKLRKPSFKFDERKLSEIHAARAKNRENDWKHTIDCAISELKDMLSDLHDLSEIQGLLIDIGTFIETVKGEGTAAVKACEEACEALYQYSMDADRDKLLKACERFTGEVDKLVNKKQVLFITTSPEKWHRFIDFYECELEDKNSEVSVMAIPYYHKKYDGTVTDKFFEPDKYPEGIVPANPEKYNIEIIHPDVIYTDYPFDKWNEATLIEEKYYIENLAANCEKLIYVQPFFINDFTSNSECEKTNAKYYMEMPGVVYSDEVYVDTETIKDRYTEQTISFAGEKNGKEIADRIKVHEFKTKVKAKIGPKKLFYYIGLASFIEYGERATVKIQENLKLFNENDNDVCVRMYVDKAVPDNLPRLDKLAMERLSDVMTQVSSSKRIEIIDDEGLKKEFDSISGYYGDAGPLVRRFVDAGKPVMIADPNVETFD
ncbi:MAG: LicD family protein [Acetatifactor sp.]|nr:LicD family protein [Acetatifactor sp.]